VEPRAKIEICRDPDDDKFLECAIDARAVHAVSGDKDLLAIGKYEGVEIVTAAEFCERYL
jgi:predicted nucleic acid-binding protein